MFLSFQIIFSFINAVVVCNNFGQIFRLGSLVSDDCSEVLKTLDFNQCSVQWPHETLVIIYARRCKNIVWN